MLLRRLALILTVTLFGTLVTGVYADATSDARKAIQTALNKYGASISKKDVEGACSIFTPDYQETSKTGQTMKVAQLKMMMGQIFPMMKSIDVKETVTKLAVKGDQATVTVAEVAKMSAVNPQTKATSNMESHETPESVWVKKGGKWLKKSSKTLTTKTIVDGKEMKTPQQ